MSSSERLRKVQRIFKRFDENGDDCLSRQEMANLVISVNPRLRFTEVQIDAILDELFGAYADFIDGQKGMRFDGFLRTYDDGAGDVDRDFHALGIHLSSDEEEELSSDEEEEEAEAEKGTMPRAEGSKGGRRS